MLVMYGVGIMLSLQTEGFMVQMIPGVELDTRLGGVHFHDAPALGIPDSRGQGQLVLPPVTPYRTSPSGTIENSLA